MCLEAYVAKTPLLLISARAKSGVQDMVGADMHPRADYLELARSLDGRILDHQGTLASPSAPVRWVARRLGADLGLALEGYRQRHETSLYFTASESVGLPLAALLGRTRIPHVMVVHRITPAKKRMFFKIPGLARSIHRYLVYSSAQVEKLLELGVRESQIRLIPFHADTSFFRPGVAWRYGYYVASAGLEWRDYPTLVEAVEGLPVQFRIAAASPWSRFGSGMERGGLPENVHVASYDYQRLRALYRGARFVVVPLKETDFQAGVTTILEAMACGKAVITTRTQGQRDVITHNQTGIYVPPGDAQALRAAITDLLEHPAKAAALGHRGRALVAGRMGTLDYAARIRAIALEAADDLSVKGLPGQVEQLPGWVSA